jgi:hypothetical protein
VHGCPLLLRWDPATLDAALAHPSPLLFLLANTRALGPDEARARIRELAAALALALARARERGLLDGWILVSRGDSTLRGHFPLEVEELAAALGPFDATFLVPAFLEGGRTTVDGVHLLHGQPVHESAFARDSLGTGRSSLLVWVVVQNVATGLASLVAGPVADRKGTRIVLVWLVALSALTPLVVTLLSLVPHAVAGEWFWLVYAPLGLNPISLKIFTGYALELAPTTAEHPRYVSIVGAALAAPFVLSPLVGLAVDAIGFRPVFLVGAGVIAAGALVALGLPEPRHREAVVSASDPGL